MTDHADAQPQDKADRRALAAVLGYSVDDEPWPPNAWPPGTRVRVIHDLEWDGPWRDEFDGTIDTTRPPQVVQNKAARPRELAYFVTFDAPQYDASGDGPYRKAQIWDRYLRSI